MDDKNAFIDIIKGNEGLIFKITTLYTNTADDRDDLYQEIVYQLWKSFSSFKEASKISTWMYRVALNTAIFHLKKSKRNVATIPMDLEILKLAEVRDSVEEEKIQKLYAHIQQLNLLEKGIVLLYLEGKNHEEIASVVGLSTSNVGTKLSRIREKLKTQIIKTKHTWN
ncbi:MULTISPECIES: RNA polymerase sigma factor [Rhodonellum]|nr:MULTISPECIES: sigma-70 family RNA polymerase sigma factor [Rhodonellum]MDO9554254.1 sigma-70 family RNA polymerase sigma factor [Rhodonellum sp.]SDZ08345.1 RNA polymerase sigma-70 factor, ECF subfamily [Rhodonellum ikkaensis]